MVEPITVEIKKVALQHERQNAIVEVQGIREKIQLEDRTIETVFYQTEDKTPSMVFSFHGGGYVLGGCALDDEMWHTISRQLGTNLVSIGYRKGEKYPFPCALNDAYDVIRYYIENEHYNFDRDKVAVLGSSAGANLSAAVSIFSCRKKEFRVGLQVLIYPFLDAATPPENKKFPAQDVPMYRYFNEAHAKVEEWSDPLVSPLYASENDLCKETEAIVILAENDGLFEEGYVYVEKLRKAGVKTACHVAKGMSHGYLEFSYHKNLEGFCPPMIISAADDGSLYTERDKTIEFIRLNFKTWANNKGR